MFKNIRTPVLGLAILVSLTACASENTRRALDQAKLACTAGDPGACNAVPGWEAQASSEQSDSAGKVAAGVLLGILLVGAAAAGAAASQQPVTTTCNRFGWQTTCTTY